jgi:hypothetical protein
MEIQQVIDVLDQYREELTGILGRFTRDRNGLHIEQQDNYRMRQVATELVDFISDHIPNSRHHSAAIANYYNQGISNWLHSSSYASVEEIRGAVESLKVRIERNPDLFRNDEGEIVVD